MLGEPEFLYLTTTGRRSGQPREVEIWFTRTDGRDYVIAETGHAAQWVWNVMTDPRVRWRVGARARADPRRGPSSSLPRRTRPGWPPSRLAPGGSTAGATGWSWSSPPADLTPAAVSPHRKGYPASGQGRRAPDCRGHAMNRPIVKLRPAKLHSGDPVTSADVRFTFECILNPQTT